MKQLIVIGGATATGKTALAIRLAQHFDTVILSADSRQFFREMSIGTAKPTATELASVKHYFIDNLSIEQDYSVGDFEKEAVGLLEELYKTKDRVILVGGSGLYLRAVCEGLDVFPEISPQTRSAVDSGYAANGIGWLQNMLQQMDPVYYRQVDKQNPARLRRAIEVCMESKMPYSSFTKQTKTPRSFTPVYLLLELPRPELYTRIDKRVDGMLEQGLEQEARNLIEYKHKAALKTVGYEEFFDYFDGRLSYAETVEKIKQHSRNYAKRQMTWFRKHGAWQVFSPGDWEGILGYLTNR